MVKLVDQLEVNGLLQRRPDPVDRRRHVLALTPKGIRTYRRSERIAEQVTDRVLSKLTTAERRTLHRLTLQALGEPTDVVT